MSTDAHNANTSQTIWPRPTNAARYAVPILSEYPKVSRYLIGFVLGLTISFMLPASPERQTVNQFAVVETYKQMIRRDDKILDLMLIGWDRSLPVYARWYFTSRMNKTWAFTQHPDPDRYYQLRF